ncbi:MAG: RNA methyltransferase [Clostridia bacterium]|nr:RNA methyltransferase [Clostridia bacterium]
MKKITSRSNEIFKSALKLTRKKYRDLEGKYLLEGIKPLKDALAQQIAVDCIFFREGVENGIGVISDDIRVIELEKSLFDELSDTENSQGVIAVVEKKPQRCFGFTSPGTVVILDRLQDPGNLGTIIRTAEAAGAAGIIAVKGTGDMYSPKVCRSAAGSLLRMPVVEGLDTKAAVKICREAGKKIAISCMEGAVDYRDAALDENTAIVIGNEGQGVSEEFMELADIKVKIPMKGEIESLNAAVAAGILMYATAGKVK